jgi:hypothetical protein
MIANLKLYPAMKDSGVPWLGESSFAEVVALIQPKLSPLVRVLSWTHNLLITGRSKYPDALEFYNIRKVLAQPLTKIIGGGK